MLLGVAEYFLQYNSSKNDPGHEDQYWDPFLEKGPIAINWIKGSKACHTSLNRCTILVLNRSRLSAQSVDSINSTVSSHVNFLFDLICSLVDDWCTNNSSMTPLTNTTLVFHAQEEFLSDFVLISVMIHMIAKQHEMNRMWHADRESK